MCNQRRTKYFVVTLIIVVVVAVCGDATAQRRGRGGLRPGNVTHVQLLAVDAVQKELKLTDEQKNKVRQINESVTIGRKKLFAEVTKESGDRGPKIAELTKKATADIEKLLDEAQRNRLQEILLQVNGAAELAKKELRDALHITDEQNAKLKELRRENIKARQESLANYEGDRMTKMLELQKAADEKLLSVLTPEQRKQFEAMQGKKLELSLFPST